MKKEYKWKVSVDGEIHVVHCEPFKTVFDVYVDGDLAIRVPRRNDEGTDMEEEIHVGSKLCRFVVYDGKPDLAVDGVLMGAERELQRRDLRYRLLMIFGGIAAAAMSAFAAFLWFVYQAAGDPIFGGYLTLTFIAIFGLCGLILLFFGLKPKKRY